ncbi:hypothetical protein FHX44_113581 [Pseudonocardia hierapolitana]|uniref:Uncharacterized protein n=1 Tax=Pseudonocardia hierapolitana TaxID=1128676 RepID=A0A561SS11_9PSEU|nr:cytochrome d ubiquinol oxidase subunit II [Pseudonocardia hierapolitana]TWF77667.1 hypothetical protein FHX44_113581 [Pseudonocardia hierapolitana]
MPVPPGPAPGNGSRPPRPRFDWRRFSRSPRGAAGLAVLAAALLLWPFAGFSWIPWMIGIAALVVLRLLRLDGPLRGWDIPLAGLAVVIGLMVSTGPWAWALAASIGVLLAGLAQLPWWRLAAVGAVLCVVSGIGFGLSVHQDRVELEQIQARAGDPMRVQLGETRAARVLPAILTAVQEDDADPICRLLTPEAEAQLLGAVRTGSCPDAVAELHRRVSGAPGQDEKSVPQPQSSPDGLVVDACSTAWSSAAGREVGRILIMQTDPAVQRFAVRGFAPCAG